MLADAGFVEHLLHGLAELGDGVAHLVFVSAKGDVEADHLPVPVDGYGLGACQILSGVIAKLADADVLHAGHVVTLWSHASAKAGRKEGVRPRSGAVVHVCLGVYAQTPLKSPLFAGKRPDCDVRRSDHESLVSMRDTNRLSRPTSTPHKQVVNPVAQGIVLAVVGKQVRERTHPPIDRRLAPGTSSRASVAA
jgi:hypothetical protein